MAIDKKLSANSSSGGRLFKALASIAAIAAIGLGVYFYIDLRNENEQLRTDLTAARQEADTYKSNPQEAARAEVRRYVDEVNKLYALPEDEEPNVATVNDKSKLSDQPFFAKAENGDVTLIYPNARLAILYRPSTKQIVNVSSVTIQEQPNSPGAN